MLRRLLWLLPVALLFWNLGYSAFWNPDEGRYVAASYEMAYPFAEVPSGGRFRLADSSSQYRCAF